MTSGLLGVIVIAEFPQSTPLGHEQHGKRPAVVVGVPDLIAQPKDEGLILVPFSSKVARYRHLSRELYPIFPEECGGLTVESVALCPQVRFLGRERLLGVLGQFTSEEFSPVYQAVRRMMGL